ncbi:hypothetical protein EX30DRAFT_340989 [Ascodesmis nigricans]|uniref:Uncharacterized protein n=1 Tax=Ascodesmis nigricans TaxID=341454 RepID=A0A4S2MWL5_9PEZI|nr:hypothetical protein EX30DRAFT_340989 [Ascodesmis nigricans]
MRTRASCSGDELRNVTGKHPYPTRCAEEENRRSRTEDREQKIRRRTEDQEENRRSGGETELCSRRGGETETEL